jgi:hypothetical protein
VPSSSTSSSRRAVRVNSTAPGFEKTFFGDVRAWQCVLCVGVSPRQLVRLPSRA